MKKILILLICFLTLCSCGGEVNSQRDRLVTMEKASVIPVCGEKNYTDVETSHKLNYTVQKAIWISYIDLADMLTGKSAEEFRENFSQACENALSIGCNTLYVHVRPFGDAIYDSELYPASKYITGVAGEQGGFDPLDIMIQTAQDKGLSFHAWINPLRCENEECFQNYDDSFLLKKWYDEDGGYLEQVERDSHLWLDPAYDEVRQLIAEGAAELAENYDIDGLHFDDYFYPEVDNNKESRWFDKPEYEASGSSLSIAQWRRENVNELIRGVYKAVKEARPSTQFGISPEGYVDHLRSDNRLFTDIDTWLSHDGYVDYIMPQIYWGFEHQLSNGSPAPFAFENNLKTWISLVKKGHAKLYIGLAMYKAGSNARDNTGIPEWKRYDDVISRQVEAGRASGAVSGYCFYEYGSFQEDVCQKEVKNLMKVFR